MTLLLLYLALFLFSYTLYRLLHGQVVRGRGLNARKTITFGDESAVTPNRFASMLSVVSLFLLWGAFTGSAWVPLHLPGPFSGDTSFHYTATTADGQRDEAVVYLRVYPIGSKVDKPPLPPQSDDGFARDDAVKLRAGRSSMVRVERNDQGGREEGYQIIAIDAQPISPLTSVNVSNGVVSMSAKGSLSYTPTKGWQMDPLWLPPPEAVATRLVEIAQDGYQNVTLAENLGWSLMRVLAGFTLGCLVGIPLGYAMGLSGWFRGWFDPIVEFMRPVPPLALIPLVIIWFGIWESGKISLLFLAALWIMTIAARAGVSGISLAKVHAAYSLGASRTQLLWHVIIPNSLPELFTGARVAMGVCWGTVVAAELVAAEKGAGKMIIAASKFQQTDVVIMGIILIGIIGYTIDILMRKAELWLVPWRGKGV